MNKSDIIKTINYIKRNGIMKAVGAVKERLTAHYDAQYEYRIPSEEELQEQRETVFHYRPLISILVPAYETDEIFMRELLDSVVNQTYDNWELIIADAGSSEKVRTTVDSYRQENSESKTNCNIKYHKLSGNNGISANTEEALQFASGDYIGLLDHDDLLTMDALFYIVKALNGGNDEESAFADETGGMKNRPLMLYSDEDKCDETSAFFYEPNHKTDFNLDLLLSNNYICHFLVLEAFLMKSLSFRSEYDGAQDYDLILRALGRIKCKEQICHIPKVLYHWRCHSASTAANPASKLYAYEAGKRALTDFIRSQNIKGIVIDTEHLGFYKVQYEPDIFTNRPEVAAVGGSLVNRDRKIVGGMLSVRNCDLTEERFAAKIYCPWQGMPEYYAGPGNLASIMQQCHALDARVMVLKPEFYDLYEEITHINYEPDLKNRDVPFCNQLDEGIWIQRSLELCEKIKSQGYILLWDPEIKINR